MENNEYGPVHRFFCFTSGPVGKFTHWASTVVKSPDVEIEVEKGKSTVTTLCPCCVFWRGVLVGGLLGLLVGSVL